MKPFLETLKSEIVVCDGAVGSFLMAQGLSRGTPSEEWNLSHPEKVEEMHRLYRKAGARILTTNSFNANRARLAQWKLDLQRVNRKAVELALKASEGKAWIFGSIGPLGEFIAPLGKLSFEEAQEIYREQVVCLVEAGVHGLVLETFSDVKELKALLTVVREVCDLPVIAQMSFGSDGRTVAGTSPEAAAVCISALRADAIGANCGTGPEDMVPVIEKLAPFTSLPLVAQPNAGLPELKDGRAIYSAPPQRMAECAVRLVEAGASVVGSCCGSTPDHTRAISDAVSGMKPRTRSVEKGVKVCSRTNWVIAGPSRPFVMIGERINPSRRPELSSELKQGVTRLLRDEAVHQADGGAQCLDVNVSIAQTDEVVLMAKVAEALEKTTELPVFVDSSNPEAIEEALKRLPGRCVINSVPKDERKLDVLLRMAGRYGCAIVALAVGEKGVAEDCRSKIEILELILREAEKHGLTEEDIFFDPAVVTLATGGKDIRETLDAVRIIHERGWTSVLGVSNVSHGMPERSLLNASFLAMAMEAGLDAAFLNPLDENIRETILASSALVRDDKLGRRYATSLARRTESVSSGGSLGLSQVRMQGHRRARRQDDRAVGGGEGDLVGDVLGTGREDGSLREKRTAEEALKRSLLEGEKEEAIDAAERILAGGRSVTELIEDVLVPAMREIGERFEKGELFLPHVVLAGEAAQGIFAFLSSRQEVSRRFRGKIVIATVEGDVHDIGKNLVSMMLATRGYEVVDLGKSVPCEEVVAKTQELKADIVAMSALLTTTMPRMGEVAQLLVQRGIKANALVGGAPVNEAFARSIGARYAPNAVEAVRKADELMGL
ncbi:MAG: homocysteine S-methyltransferase family protein [Candidatus Eisenbacteria bacterium]|nr:homocysteine S-methyltransferase family protein [Candidatus Eisenbacteria bacterium]